MATHSSTLAWKIPWMEEPGRLQSMGSLRVRHDWATSLSLFTYMHWRRKWQPTPVFLLENPRDGGAPWAAVYGVTQSRTQLKRLSSSSKLFVKRQYTCRQVHIPYVCNLMSFPIAHISVNSMQIKNQDVTTIPIVGRASQPQCYWGFRLDSSCCGELSCALQVFSPTPGLYPLAASGNPPSQ